MSTLQHFLRKTFSPPVFQDEELTRRARVVHILYLSIIGASMVGILGDLEIISTIVIMIAGILLSTFAYKLNVRGQPERSGFIMLSIMMCGILALLLTGNGIHDIAVIVMPVLFFIAALILERRRFIQFAFLALGVLVFAFYAENNLPWFGIHPATGTNVSDLFIVIAIMAIAAVSSYYLKNRLSVSLNRSHLADARIRALVENSPDFTLEIERSGKIVFINRFAEAYLGKNVREVLPADRVNSALQVIEKAFTSGEPQAIELQTIAPDGRVSWDSIRIGPIKSGGQTTSLTVIMTEITAQREAEAALRAREELYRLISTITADYVFSTQLEADGQFRLKWVGGGFESITGYTFEEYVARGGWRAALHPDDQAVDAHDMLSLQANQDVSSEVRTIHKNGDVRWVRVSAHPLWDTEHDRLTGIHGAVQDITTRKEAEEKILQTSNQLSMTNEIGRAVTELNDLESVLEIIREKVAQVIPLDFFLISLYDAETKILSFPLCYEKGKYWQESATVMTPGISTSRVIQTGMSILSLLTPEELMARQESSEFLLSDNQLGDRSRVSGSLMFVPLITKGKVFGVMSAQSYDLNAYTEENLRLLEGVALQAAIAIENAQLFTSMQQELAQRERAEAELQKSASRLELLHNIDQALLSMQSHTEIAREALTRIRQLVPSQRVSITLFDFEKNEAIFLVASFDEDFNPAGQSVITLQEYGQYIIDVLLQGKACRLDDVLTDLRCNELDKALAQTGFRSWLYLPLLSQGQLIGGLNFGRAAGNPFTAEEESIAYEVANQLAIVLKQSQLYESLQIELTERKQAEEKIRKTANQLVVLNEIDRIISEVTDLDSALEIIRQQLEKLVPFDCYSVRIFNATESTVTYLAVYENGKYWDEPDTPLIPGTHAWRVFENGESLLHLLKEAEVEHDRSIPYPHIGDRSQLTTSLIFVPLKKQGKTIGTLSVQRYQPNSYTIEHLKLVEAVAIQVAIAIENARLFTDLQTELEERKQVESALRESEERYELAVRGANDGLWDWDLRTNAIYCSPRWKSMLGIGEDEILNDPQEWFKRIHPDDLAEFKALLDAHLGGRRAHLEAEYRISHASGKERWMLCRGLAVRDAEGRAYRMSGSQTDITDRKIAEERLTHDALHDVLTGLPNRNLFLDRLGRRLEYGKRRKNRLFAVLFLDLDRFKVINDSLGHSAGDEFLVAVAQQFQTCLRQEDTISRLGGDEFAILLNEINDVGDAIHVAERLQSRLSQGVMLGSVNRSSSTSIGITVFNGQYSIPEELLRDADTAMYRAKALGGGCCEVFDVKMYESAIALLELEADLKRAVENREWLVHYQPILSLDDGGISGLEALVRWNSSKRGIVPPADFIPLAEESGLIISIGEYVLREACAQLKIWRRKGHANLWVSVNISGRQFRDRNFVNMVKGILKESRLPGLCLRLEITESVAMKDFENSVNVLRILKKSGIHFSLDDFGKGYSSLSYLKNFPLKTLKIDRSFVQDIGLGRKREAIAASIIAMGHSLGMKVVAEGVETREQLAFLRTNSCDEVQGFLFSRPLPQEEISRMIEGKQSLFHK